MNVTKINRELEKVGGHYVQNVIIKDADISVNVNNIQNDNDLS